MMESHNVPSNKRVVVPNIENPCVQPYQEVCSYLVHPNSYSMPNSKHPSQRLLVVHRTGAGKTCTMIRIADNYFKDKRPKVIHVTTGN